MDVYFKKEITYVFKEVEYSFDVANTLFSTFDIDHGTDVLIRAINTEHPKHILDIGCGYGPLGIMLAKSNPQAEVLMTDKDLLAVRYTGYNIAKNNVTNAKVVAGLATEPAAGMEFDLIVSNIPAKIGDQAISEEFIMKPYNLLKPGGEYWCVVVSGLNRLIPLICGKNKIKVKKIRKRSGHTVYRIKKGPFNAEA